MEEGPLCAIAAPLALRQRVRGKVERERLRTPAATLAWRRQGEAVEAAEPWSRQEVKGKGTPLAAALPRRGTRKPEGKMAGSAGI